MSLLITSSKQAGTVFAPNQYRNNIKNPLIVKKDSQIAVDSIKIQRGEILDYTESINTFFWFGERLAKNASYDEAISYMIPQENDIRDGLSVTDFAEEFKEKILKPAYSLHPEIKSTDIECNVVSDSDGKFTNFQYKIPQVGSNPTSIVPPASTNPFNGTGTYIELVNGSGMPNWDGTTLDAQSDDCHFQLQPQGSDGGPLSLHNGSVTFSTITVNDNFVCGLARPFIVPDDGSDEAFTNFSGFQAPFGLGDLDRDFYDYAVEVSDDGGIRAFHAVPYDEFQPDSPEFPSFHRTDILEMREITYFEKDNGSFTANNGSNSSFVTGTPIPSASLGDITFEASGEKMKISISGKTLVEVNRVNASTKDQIPKPIGQTCWKMYPTVSFGTNGDSCDITNYACRTSTTIHNNVAHNNWNSRCLYPIELLTVSNDGEPTFEVGTLSPYLNAFNWPSIIDTKDCYQTYVANPDTPNDPVRGGTLRDYRGITNNLIGESGKRYENIFIVGKSERYIQSAPSYVNQPNSAAVLGFQPQSINLDSGITHGGGYHGASFTSSVKPELTSNQSTFIRVPTLTHETYNFSTGNPSKILFQVPKFDNSGNETGALFYQNNDKFFVDLNNTTDIRVTDLDVHFVRSNERFVTDLTGASQVIFCIREKPKM